MHSRQVSARLASINIYSWLPEQLVGIQSSLHCSCLTIYYWIHWTVHSLKIMIDSSLLFGLRTWLVQATEMIMWHANPCHSIVHTRICMSHDPLVARISHMSHSNNEDESIVIFDCEQFSEFGSTNVPYPWNLSQCWYKQEFQLKVLEM